MSVRGTVIRVSNVKLICRWMAFECGSCRGKQVLKQPDGVYTVPTRCDTNGCKAQTRFTPVLSSPHTRTDNWQMLKLQELVGTDQVCNICCRYFTTLRSFMMFYLCSVKVAEYLELSNVN